MGEVEVFFATAAVGSALIVVSLWGGKITSGRLNSRHRDGDYLCWPANNAGTILVVPPSPCTRVSANLIYMDILLPAVAVLALVIVAVLAYLVNQTLDTVQELAAHVRERGLAVEKAAARQQNVGVDTATFRLQACERFTLMTERINAPNLLLRHPAPPATGAKEYTAQLLLSIREEFEYNVTQQVYVSDALWSVLLQARDNVSQLIIGAAEEATTAEQVAARLRAMSANQPHDAIALAQSAIRREATQVLL